MSMEPALFSETSDSYPGSPEGEVAPEIPAPRFPNVLLWVEIRNTERNHIYVLGPYVDSPQDMKLLTIDLMEACEDRSRGNRDAAMITAKSKVERLLNKEENVDWPGARYGSFIFNLIQGLESPDEEKTFDAVKDIITKGDRQFIYVVLPRVIPPDLKVTIESDEDPIRALDNQSHYNSGHLAFPHEPRIGSFMKSNIAKECVKMHLEGEMQDGYTLLWPETIDKEGVYMGRVMNGNQLVKLVTMMEVRCDPDERVNSKMKGTV